MPGPQEHDDALPAEKGDETRRENDAAPEADAAMRAPGDDPAPAEDADDTVIRAAETGEPTAPLPEADFDHPSGYPAPGDDAGEPGDLDDAPAEGEARSEEAAAPLPDPLPPVPPAAAASPAETDSAQGSQPPVTRSGGHRAAPNRRFPLWAVIVGAIAVIAIIAGLIAYAVASSHAPSGPQPAPAPTTSSAPPSQKADAEGIVDGSPAAAVRDLGAALSKGDATTALGLIADTATVAGENMAPTLLSNANYGAAKNRPTAVDIDPASLGVPAPEVIRARVTAEVTQAGKKTRVTFDVARASADAPWKISPAALPTVAVGGASGTTIRVNGKDVKVPGSPGDYITTRFQVLPGSYAVGGRGDKFTTFGKPKTVGIAPSALGTRPPSSAPAVQLTAERTDAFKKAAIAAVDAWLNECAKSTSTAPANCPLRSESSYQGAPITNVEWSIDRRPALTFDDYGVGEDSVTGRNGRAIMTGQAKVGGRTQDIKGTLDNFVYRGDLTVKGDEVTFHYVG